MKRWQLLASSLIGAVASSGCTTFHQTYHFQSTAGDGTVNFFRVRVDGDAQTAKTRYLAGFYDERAVDLFFNELKSTDKDLRPIFVTGQKAPGEDTAIKPLTPDKGRGTFVMIFSTNPKAVADTIGAFAESQVVSDALSNLVNRREVQAARVLTATKSVSDTSATAIADELKALLPPTADSPPSGESLKRDYLRALQSIARETGGPSQLADFPAAKAWLGRPK